MQERIGKYCVQKELGEGGSSVVFLAFDDFYNADIAIKVYTRGLPDDESAHSRKMFLAEASTLRAHCSAHWRTVCLYRTRASRA